MNTKVYEQAVDKIADMKKDLHEKNQTYKAIHHIFKDVFQREPQEITDVAKMKFFRDGFPDPDGVSKLHRFLDRFAVLVHFYHFMEDDEIEKYLQAKGVEISNHVQLVDLQLNQGQIDSEDWDDAFEKAKQPERTKELFETLLARMLEEFEGTYQGQKDIELIAESVETSENIKKSHVRRAGSLRYKQLIQKPIEKDLKKIGENIESMNNSLIIFDKPQP